MGHQPSGHHESQRRHNQRKTEGYRPSNNKRTGPGIHNVGGHTEMKNGEESSHKEGHHPGDEDLGGD